MKTMLTSSTAKHIKSEVNKLNELLEDNTKHLTDAAMCIGFIIKRIDALCHVLYQEHRDEINGVI